MKQKPEDLVLDNPFILIYQLAHLSGEEDEAYFKLRRVWSHLTDGEGHRSDYVDWVIKKGRWAA